ncbi:hypothetical protein C0J52_09693 [Blattella germanica]|nr:hypothetical protein C0J52_09693 [Blattella germanica]
MHLQGERKKPRLVESNMQFHFKEEDWLENFRMSSNTFELICQRLKPHLKPSKNAIRKTISLRKQVAIAL